MVHRVQSVGANDPLFMGFSFLERYAPSNMWLEGHFLLQTAENPLENSITVHKQSHNIDDDSICTHNILL